MVSLQDWLIRDDLSILLHIEFLELDASHAANLRKGKYFKAALHMLLGNSVSFMKKSEVGLLHVRWNSYMDLLCFSFCFEQNQQVRVENLLKVSCWERQSWAWEAYAYQMSFNTTFYHQKICDFIYLCFIHVMYV